MFIILRIFLIIIVLLLYGLYLNRSFKHLNKKVYKLISEKKFTEANAIIDREIKNHPLDISFYYMKIISLFESGDVVAFVSLIEHIKSKKINLRKYKIYIYNLWIKVMFLTGNISGVNVITNEYNQLINSSKDISKKAILIPALFNYYENNYTESISGLEETLNKNISNADKIICKIFLIRIYRNLEKFEEMCSILNDTKQLVKGTLYETFLINEFSLEDTANADK